MAPEFLADKISSKKSDVYAFGVVLWEIFSRQIAFEDQNEAQIIFAVAHQGKRPDISQVKIKDKEKDSKVKTLIEMCWSQDPHDRPEIREILETLKAIRAKV